MHSKSVFVVFSLDSINFSCFSRPGNVLRNNGKNRRGNVEETLSQCWIYTFHMKRRLTRLKIREGSIRQRRIQWKMKVHSCFQFLSFRWQTNFTRSKSQYIHLYIQLFHYPQKRKMVFVLFSQTLVAKQTNGKLIFGKQIKWQVVLVIF